MHCHRERTIQNVCKGDIVHDTGRANVRGDKESLKITRIPISPRGNKEATRLAYIAEAVDNVCKIWLM